MNADRNFVHREAIGVYIASAVIGGSSLVEAVSGTFLVLECQLSAEREFLREVTACLYTHFPTS
jgi:hypothetical protein